MDTSGFRQDHAPPNPAHSTLPTPVPASPVNCQPSDYASDCASPRSRRMSTIAAWVDCRSMPDRLYGDFVVYPDTRWPNPTAQSGCCRSLPRACGEARNGRLNGTSAAQPLGSGRQKRGKRRDIFATLQAADRLDRSIHFLGGQAIGGERAKLRFQLRPADVRFVTRKLDGFDATSAHRSVGSSPHGTCAVHRTTQAQPPGLLQSESV